MVATLSQWQNLKHTIDDPSIATAESEGRKIGIQLFDQAQEMEACAVLPKLVKWLEQIIADTYHNFTMPSKKDREESGSVYSWSHTQRLDYNFFKGIRSEIVGLVKDSQRARQAVPENCRGGFEHLVVSSDVQKSVPAPAPASASTPAATEGEPLLDGQGAIIPPVFGGLQIQQPYNQTIEAMRHATAMLKSRQQLNFRQSLTYVPHEERPATTTGLRTPQSEERPILTRGAEAPVTHGIGINSTSQSVNGKGSGVIPVQYQKPLAPNGTTPGATSGPYSYLVKNTDFVRALPHAVEKDKATAPYTSFPYSSPHVPQFYPFAKPPPEQHKEVSKTHGVDDTWMEKYVDLSGGAPPAGVAAMTAETGNRDGAPEKAFFPVEDMPDAPRPNIVAPERRGSDSAGHSDMESGVLSDAGSVSVATSPEADMDEVDMIKTDHMRRTAPNA